MLLLHFLLYNDILYKSAKSCNLFNSIYSICSMQKKKKKFGHAISVGLDTWVFCVCVCVCLYIPILLCNIEEMELPGAIWWVVPLCLFWRDVVVRCGSRGMSRRAVSTILHSVLLPHPSHVMVTHFAAHLKKPCIHTQPDTHAHITYEPPTVQQASGFN